MIAKSKLATIIIVASLLFAIISSLGEYFNVRKKSKHDAFWKIFLRRFFQAAWIVALVIAVFFGCFFGALWIGGVF